LKSVLEYTGERIVPGKVEPELLNEHLVRYLLAARFARGGRVLDAGCGVGYGTDLLAARGARLAIGIDVSAESLGSGRSHVTRPNLLFAVGSATSTCFTSGAFQVVVAFELIEHLAAQEELVAELARLLGEDGVAVLSTPNRAARPPGAPPNPYHVRELTAEEFSGLLGKRFPTVHLLSQGYLYGISLCPLGDQGAGAGAPARLIADLLPSFPEPQYLVAVCSRRRDAPPPAEIYALSRDREESILKSVEGRPDPVAALRLARYLVHACFYDAALAFARAVERCGGAPPAAGEWHYLVAFSLHQVGSDPQEALRRYALALERGQDEFWVRYNRGALLLVLGLADRAAADLERAVELKPEHRDARALLALLGAK